MNEITKIHLGRQAFVVSVDAYKALQDYLRAIKKHMGDSSEAVEEVELRMAELLAERGISGKKVVLLKDVDYLKSQLGKPGDFGDEAVEEESPREDSTAQKRLFRDTKHGMIAGVAAGVAAYLGVKPIIVRAFFILVLLSGFGGLFNVSFMGGFWLMGLLYIALWIAIPEANTGSERLQMQGKPVTVDAIKEAVERADVKTAATHAQHVVRVLLRGFVKFVLALVGYGLMIAGVAALLGLTTLGVYWLLNHDFIPSHIFPVGTGEVVLVCLAFVVAISVALFLLVTGLAVARRKWPLPSWGLGAIVAVFLASLAVSGALAADAAPKIKHRYDATHHTYSRTVSEFHKLAVEGGPEINVRYEKSPTYGVSVSYWGSANIFKLKTEVKDQTLTVDTHALADSMRCQKPFCLLADPTIDVVIHGSKLQEVTSDLVGGELLLPELHDQTLTLHAGNGSIAIQDFTADIFTAVLGKNNIWALTFAGKHRGTTFPQQASFYEGTASLSAQNINLKFDGKCSVDGGLSTGPSIQADNFDVLTINGEKIGRPADLQALFDKPGRSAAKCVNPVSYVSDSW